MLGFAVIDRRPSAMETAIWLTSRVAEARVNHTNAVIIDHGDEDYAKKVRSLVADRVIVLTADSVVPMEFAHPVSLSVFADLIAETIAYQQRIGEAIAAARNSKRKFTDPDFPRQVPSLEAAEPDDPAHRALATANYIADCWEFWLRTDQQRVRRTVNAKTGEPPGIMPPGLDDLELTELPPRFGVVAQPEALTTQAAS